MRHTKLCLAAVVMIVLVLAPTVSFGSDYLVRALKHTGGVTETLAESQGATPPQVIQGTWQAPPRVMSYYGEMDRGQYKFRLGVYNGTGPQYIYSIAADATWDDFVFECDDGRASVNVVANLRIKGEVSFSSDAYSFFELRFGYSQGYKTAWYTSHGYASTPYSSNGPFASLTGNTIDGLFPIPLFNNPVPTGVSISVSLGNGYGGDVGGTFNILPGNAVADFRTGDNGISFSTTGPAFDLPDGCTCNSAEANIVDNVWQGVDPTVPVEKSTWGEIKALFR